MRRVVCCAGLAYELFVSVLLGGILLQLMDGDQKNCGVWWTVEAVPMLPPCVDLFSTGRSNPGAWQQRIPGCAFTADRTEREDEQEGLGELELRETVVHQTTHLEANNALAQILSTHLCGLDGVKLAQSWKYFHRGTTLQQSLQDAKEHDVWPRLKLFAVCQRAKKLWQQFQPRVTPFHMDESQVRPHTPHLDQHFSRLLLEVEPPSSTRLSTLDCILRGLLLLTECVARLEEFHFPNMQACVHQELHDRGFFPRTHVRFPPVAEELWHASRWTLALVHAQLRQHFTYQDVCTLQTCTDISEWNAAVDRVLEEIFTLLPIDVRLRRMEILLPHLRDFWARECPHVSAAYLQWDPKLPRVHLREKSWHRLLGSWVGRDAPHSLEGCPTGWFLDGHAVLRQLHRIRSQLHCRRMLTIQRTTRMLWEMRREVVQEMGHAMGVSLAVWFLAVLVRSVWHVGSAEWLAYVSSALMDVGGWRSFVPILGTTLALYIGSCVLDAKQISECREAARLFPWPPTRWMLEQAQLERTKTRFRRHPAEEEEAW